MPGKRAASGTFTCPEEAPSALWPARRRTPIPGGEARCKPPPRDGYGRYRFPPEIISHGVWLYHRFSLSFRDVEEPLAKRGLVVTYETIRQWCRKFGPEYARNLKRRQGRLGDVWHLDEAFVKIRGERH